MALLLGLDLETSNLTPEEGHILEIGYVLKRVGESRPWLLRSEFIYEPEWGTDFVPHEAHLVNAIHPQHCIRFGRPLKDVARELVKIIEEHKVDFIVAHNAAFDIPFLLAKLAPYPELQAALAKVPVICTMIHVPYERSITTRALSFLAASKGFINPFPHSALPDVLTMFLVLEKYSIDEVIANAKENSAIYKACVDYENRQRAKENGFRWCEIEGKKFDKTWVKRLRDSEIEGVVAKLGFAVKKISD